MCFLIGKILSYASLRFLVTKGMPYIRLFLFSVVDLPYGHHLPSKWGSVEILWFEGLSMGFYPHR